MRFSAVTSLISDAVVLLPVAAVLATVISWARIRHGLPWRGAVRDSVFDALALCALAPVIILTLVNPGGGGESVVLVPFSDMGQSGIGMTGLYQDFGNIALFVPLGALLPLALGRRLAGLPRVLAAAGAVSITVEVFQYFLGRTASVDDVILNCTGALVGAVLTWPWWRERTGSGHRGRPGAAKGSGSPSPAPGIG